MINNKEESINNLYRLLTLRQYPLNHKEQHFYDYVRKRVYGRQGRYPSKLTKYTLDRAYQRYCLVYSRSSD